jgi:hypothetical protein
MTTKDEMHRLVVAGIANETFQHETLGHFDITMMRRAIELVKDRLTVYSCNFDQLGMVDGIEADGYTYLTQHREIDRERVKNLTDEQIEEPLIILDCPAGTNGTGRSDLLVDGIHRLVARKERGKEGFSFYRLPLEHAPRIDDSKVGVDFVQLQWGEKDLIPGQGLVERKK